MLPIFKFPKDRHEIERGQSYADRMVSTLTPCGFTDEYIAKRGWEATSSIILPGGDPDYLWNTCPKIYGEMAEFYGTRFIENAIASWLEENCEHRYDRFGKLGVEFEDEDDAVLFRLSWAL